MDFTDFSANVDFSRVITQKHFVSLRYSQLNHKMPHLHIQDNYFHPFVAPICNSLPNKSNA